MGRPREHDDTTRAALRAAAERLVNEGGVEALSVRAVAEAARTTTRAVYALFGSKEGLFVDALAQGAFDFLYAEMRAQRETWSPVADLVAVGLVFRRLVVEHPARYRIAFQRVVPGLAPGPELAAARGRAWGQLVARVQRLADAGLLGKRSVEQAAVEVNAMLEEIGRASCRERV